MFIKVYKQILVRYPLTNSVRDQELTNNMTQKYVRFDPACEASGAWQASVERPTGDGRDKGRFLIA